MRHRFAPVEYTDTRRGRVWVGYSPFEWKRDVGLLAWSGLWIIDHPDADAAKFYRVVGVESHCVPVIRRNAPVGIVFEECGK